MKTGARSFERLLLIDTCGEAGAVALSRAGAIVRLEMLAGRTASAQLVGTVKHLLQEEGWTLADIEGVGVVAGPGSFTGVRTGLSVGKGLCEVTGLPLASVSRLAVLAEAAELHEGFAVLNAGRSGLYVREQSRTESPREWMATLDKFKHSAAGAPIVVAEEKTAELLDALAPRVHVLRAADLLDPVRHCLEAGGTDVAWADANYVLPESEIYARPKHKSNAG